MKHERHRARMRKKLFSKTHLEDHEILEMLLFYSLPRINTNEIAHSLINDCGSLGRVFAADTKKLTSVSGVGEHTSAFCTLVGETVKRSMLELCDLNKLLTSHTELTKYLCSLFFDAEEERAYAICFGPRKKYVCTLQIGDGIYDEAILHVKRALLKICKCGCTSVLIVHNHPSGILKASEMDVITAEKLNLLFERAGISIEGHYVYADGACVRFSDKK